MEGIFNATIFSGEEVEKYRSSYEKQKVEIFEECQAQYPNAEITNYVILEMKRIKREDKACEKCKCAPCQKTHNKYYRHKIICDGTKINIYVTECPFMSAAKLQRKINSQFKKSQIPAKYIGKTFEDYEVTGANEKAVNWAKYKIENLQKGMYFYGSPGVGKTFLVSIMAQEYLKRGKSVIFIDVPNLLEKLRSTYDKGSENTIDEMMESLTRVEILILDDLGAENSTEWAIEKLYLIINGRYISNRLTIVTSNYNLNDVAVRMNAKKVEGGRITGDRIASRVKEMCNVCKIDGADRRIKK